MSETNGDAEDIRSRSLSGFQMVTLCNILLLLIVLSSFVYIF